MASEYLAPTILSSRRLFGPNLFSRDAGAVLDVVCDSDVGRRAVAAWSSEALRLAGALGWADATCHTLPFRDSASLFLAAPVDGLLTASDLTEHAWVAAEARAVGHMTDDAAPLLRSAYAREQQALPHVIAMQRHARQHGLAFSLDDESCSIGGGIGACVVPHADRKHHMARPASWADARNIPLVMVTGSNGKTTTTRLIAAMSRAAGRRTGWSCSDGVWIDDTQVESGDYTGPGGARRVVCDPRVEFAVLETARGGMLRRGLAVDRIDVAVITNISADHFGEYGVETLDDLARAKAIVLRALRPGAPVVLNADDPTLVALARGIAAPVAWFAVGPREATRERVREGAERTGHAALVQDGQLRLCRDGEWLDFGAVSAMPITLGARASHNIANAAAAALVASLAGIPVDDIRRTLADFGANPTDNPGRLMLRALGGVTLVMDYAHNPDGIASLCRTAAMLPATRRLLLLGQAGNRDDAQLRALARTAWETQPFDRVIVKEMTAMLRGRAAGELPAILRSSLLDAGAPADAIGMAPSELDGVRDALQWACEGDVLVLGVHVSREPVLALVDQLAKTGWRAGDALPSALTSASPAEPSATSP